VYLGSPAVVAASAVSGYISAPTRFTETKARARVVRKHEEKQGEQKAVTIIQGFPAQVRGRLLWLDRDNLNTDGIYAGKHTYNDNMTREQMAAVIFENYDPEFRSKAHPGDVVVGGLNFGTGSSREQAATALKYFGIPCVVAASFSETYKRNAFNNGFVVFECPGLVEWLRQSGAGQQNGGTGRAKTVLVGDTEIDYARSVIRVAGKEFHFPALSPVAQELVVAGGAEAVVKRRLGGT